jgi:hypothetical protein
MKDLLAILTNEINNHTNALDKQLEQTNEFGLLGVSTKEALLNENAILHIKFLFETKEYLDQLNIEIPNYQSEYINKLRAFKKNKKLLQDPLFQDCFLEILTQYSIYEIISFVKKVQTDNYYPENAIIDYDIYITLCPILGYFIKCEYEC